MATVDLKTAASFAVLFEDARKKDKVRGEQNGGESFSMTRKRGSKLVASVPRVAQDKRLGTRILTCTVGGKSTA